MLFGKYWWLVPVAIVIILALAVVVQYTKDTNDIAEWIFNFLKEWAVILSASIAVVLVIATLMAVRENRRTQALDRIRVWAENVLQILVGPGKGTEKDKKFQALWVGSYSISADARFIGGNLKVRTGEAITKLNKFHKLMEDKDSSAINKEFLESLTASLFAVIESASGL